MEGLSYTRIAVDQLIGKASRTGSENRLFGQKISLGESKHRAEHRAARSPFVNATPHEEEVHMRKLATLAAAAIVAAGIPLFAAAPAQAAPDYAYKCMKYLDGKGYRIGPKVQAACSDEILHCQQGLQRAGVRQSHAIWACEEGRG